jgi:hypothetical protein
LLFNDNHPAYFNELKPKIPYRLKIDCRLDRKVPWDELKIKYRRRIQSILDHGEVPIIDVESSYGDSPTYSRDVFLSFSDQIPFLDKIFNSFGLAVVMYSPEIQFKLRYNNKNISHRFEFSNCDNFVFLDLNYDWFFPVPAAGKMESHDSNHFVESMLKSTLNHDYKMLGEFFFRHYANSFQLIRLKNSNFADMYVPIYGDVADKIFSFSQKYGIPFQIHLEVEDKLLKDFEQELKKFPKAKVIWAHLGRVRKPELNTIYNVKYVEYLLRRYPNLYFDLSTLAIATRWRVNGEYDSMVWDHSTGLLLPEWKNLISRNPNRFLMALDFGSDRNSLFEVNKKLMNARKLLSNFDLKTQKIISYQAAWKLIFNESIE